MHWEDELRLTVGPKWRRVAHNYYILEDTGRPLPTGIGSVLISYEQLKKANHSHYIIVTTNLSFKPLFSEFV